MEEYIPNCANSHLRSDSCKLVRRGWEGWIRLGYRKIVDCELFFAVQIVAINISLIATLPLSYCSIFLNGFLKEESILFYFSVFQLFFYIWLLLQTLNWKYPNSQNQVDIVPPS